MGLASPHPPQGAAGTPRPSDAAISRLLREWLRTRAYSSDLYTRTLAVLIALDK